jgi:hypothetical protein
MEKVDDDYVTLCIKIHELISAEELYKQVMGKVGSKIYYCGDRIITEVEHAPGSNFLYITARKRNESNEVY